jgi:hypothetical protein
MTASTFPDRRGYFGEFGGKYVPETLMAALDELESAYRAVRRDRTFKAELDGILADYVGRPSPRPGVSRQPVAAFGSSSSARTSITPARTRSTTPSARR